MEKVMGKFLTVAAVSFIGICSLAGCTYIPATGQTTSFGPASDGAVRAGPALSYADNGDGTITDKNTGLMWEKKDDSGGIHDKDNAYTWSSEESVAMDGTIVTVFLSSLNTPPCFAGHCDWRIPNVKELFSIMNHEGGGATSPPMVDPIFAAAGCPGCTDVRQAACSCTESIYWSSTTDRDLFGEAFTVGFTFGLVNPDVKKFPTAVRAVR